LLRRGRFPETELFVDTGQSLPIASVPAVS
jgi:hypothetical protein